MQDPGHLSEKQSKSDALDSEEESLELDIIEKVIPLYVPDDAVVKVFMVHGSQKSALVLSTFSLGFQQQVIAISYFRLSKATLRLYFICVYSYSAKRILFKVWLIKKSFARTSI